MAYSNNVIRQAEGILGYGISDTAGERTYSVIDNVVYTDVFTGEVIIDGYTGTIKKAFNGHVNAIEYYNELILDDTTCLDEVAVTLTWGSDTFMQDIDGLLTWLDDNDQTDLLDNAGVSTKKIEDFSVTFRDADGATDDMMTALNRSYGYYIRKPLIISVASEQRYDHRYF